MPAQLNISSLQPQAGPLSLSSVLQLREVGNSRESVDWLYSDGVTPSRRCEWLMGASANVAGSALSEVGHVFRVPNSSVGTEASVVAYVGTQTPTNWSGNSNCLAITVSADDLLIRRNADSSNRDIWRFPNWRTLNSGKTVRLDIIGGSADALPLIYQDGVLLTGLVLLFTTGTPPATWLPSALVGTYRLCGFNWPNSEFCPGTPINRALTADEVSQMVATGSLLPADRLGGSQAHQITAGFTDGPGNIANFVSADGLGWSGDVTTSAWRVQGITSTLQAVANKPFRVRLTLANFAVNVVITLREGPTTTASNSISLPNGTHEFLLTPTISGNLRLNFVSSSSANASGVIVSGINVVPLGALLQPEITRSAQILDIGPNRIRGMLSNGMRPLTSSPVTSLKISASTTGTFVTGSSTNPLWYESGYIASVRARPSVSGSLLTIRRSSTSSNTIVDSVDTGVANIWSGNLTTSSSQTEFSAGDNLWVSCSAGTVDIEITWRRR